jgi:hypothetical protein
MARMSRKNVLKYLGASPDQIGAELATFTEAAKVLSSDHPRLINTHPMEWVGIFDGAVAVSADNYAGLMSKLSARGIPPSQTVVRFIDRTEKTFIL